MAINKEVLQFILMFIVGSDIGEMGSLMWEETGKPGGHPLTVQEVCQCEISQFIPSCIFIYVKAL